MLVFIVRSLVDMALPVLIRLAVSATAAVSIRWSVGICGG